MIQMKIKKFLLRSGLQIINTRKLKRTKVISESPLEAREVLLRNFDTEKPVTKMKIH